MPTLPVTPAELAIAILLATVGSVVQGSIGFGLAVVAAPILLLINPVWVPGPMLLAATLLVVLIVWRDRRHVILRDVALGTVGRIIGTLPAAYAMAMLPLSAYELLFGLLVLLGVALSAAGWHIRPTAANVTAAATLSGFTGTVASIGGPPMALVYQNEKGPRIRGTMSAIFINGTIISLLGLWWAGHFGPVEFALGLTLMPGVLIGFSLSRYTAAWLDLRHTRPAVLAISTLSALAVLARAVWQY